MKLFGKRSEGGGIKIDPRKSTTVAMPLEQEVAKMKRMKMPIRGGATPIYGDEDGEVIIGTEFKQDLMDLMRMEGSKAMVQKLKEMDGGGLEGLRKPEVERAEGAD